MSFVKRKIFSTLTGHNVHLIVPPPLKISIEKKDCPTFVCTSCQRTWFQGSVNLAQFFWPIEETSRTQTLLSLRKLSKDISRSMGKSTFVGLVALS